MRADPARAVRAKRTLHVDIWPSSVQVASDFNVLLTIKATPIIARTPTIATVAADFIFLMFVCSKY